MTPEDLTSFKDRLEQERHRIQRGLAMVGPSKESITPDNAIGRLTRMEALQAQSMSEATRVRQQKRLKQVELALKRVEDGRYGTCIHCGAEIPLGRLEGMPEARTCMACARSR